MDVNALTDVGKVRKENEDNYLVSPERGLFVVADGMGGHLGGQVASSLAIQTIDQEIPLLTKECDPRQLLKQALEKANEQILKRGKSEEDYQGMGTTVTAALVFENNLYVAHIGDSRAYLFQKGHLRCLTEDHSLVNELFQNGSLTLEEAQNHPQRNILTRALGSHENPQIDIQTFPVEENDKLLLCTDGLYNHLPDEEIGELLGLEYTLKETIQQMVDTALERGGNDNITVVLVQYQ